MPLVCGRRFFCPTGAFAGNILFHVTILLRTHVRSPAYAGISYANSKMIIQWQWWDCNRSLGSNWMKLDMICQ